jgi:hypothetical protein
MFEVEEKGTCVLDVLCGISKNCEQLLEVADERTALTRARS